MSIQQSSQSLIERLFSAGAHFGFSKSRRHPSIAKYIFTHKDGTDIFDLEKTAILIENAKKVLFEAGQQGKTVLFVSTKAEASPLVLASATKAGMPSVTNRWIGGMLTNFSEIKRRVDLLKSRLAEKESGELDRKYTKKERVMINRDITKLQFNFSGIAEMPQTPHFMLVVDPRHDCIAVQEARDKGVPIIAIMSSDCDAKSVQYPVVVNDAHKASITLALYELTEAFIAGRKEFVPVPVRAPRTDSRSPRTSRPAPESRR